MKATPRASSPSRLPHFVPAFFILLVPQTLPAQTHFTVVAKSGDPAPGLNDVFRVFGSPLINNSGQVAFFGAVSDPVGTGSAGVYVGTPGDLHAIAKSGDPAPGSPAGVTFVVPYPTSFSDTGQVAIGSDLQGSGTNVLNSSGVWVGSPNAPLTYVARNQSPAQGFPAPAVYWGTRTPQLAGGAIIFSGTLGSVPPADGEMALWAGTVANFNPIARHFAAPPGVNDALYGGWFSPALNAAGQIAFSDDLATLDKQYSPQAGLWYGTPASQQLVLRTGDAAPQIPGKTVSFVYSFTLNGKGGLGVVTQLGQFDGGGPDLQFDDVAIYTGTPGNFQLRARTGQPAPGMPAGVFFGGENDFGHGAISFQKVQHNSHDDIAFRGLVSGAGIDITNNDGLWLGRAGQPLKLIAREGEQAPGMPPGTKFIQSIDDIDQYNPTFSNPCINNKGQIVFISSTSDGTGPYPYTGIWGTDVDDSLHLIASIGTQIDLGNGLTKTISYFPGLEVYDPGAASEDGQNFIFNDAGQLAFTAQFTDGTSAILIADVPEPSTGTIAALATGLTCRRRRRHTPAITPA